MQRQNLYTPEDHFRSFQKGEEQGFDYLFELYYKPLTHFAFVFLKETQASEDVVQESFIKLWEKRETIGSLSAIKPYLYTSVRNRCIDLLRRQVHQEAYVIHINKLPRENAPDVTEKIITSEAMHQIYIALQKLPSKYKQVLNMLYVEGKEVKEIATEHDLPLSTVKSQKQRALELLRKQLACLGCVLLVILTNKG